MDVVVDCMRHAVDDQLERDIDALHPNDSISHDPLGTISRFRLVNDVLKLLKAAQWSRENSPP
jgi:hypothetical protein